MSQGVQIGTGILGTADEMTGQGQPKRDNSLEAIAVHDEQDPTNVEDEKREPSENADAKESPGIRGNKNQSIMSSFRDFFLAAFSDSYSYQDVRA
jgi:hypothetical protein